MSKTIDCITAGSCVLDILAHPVNLNEPLITKAVHRISPMQLSCGGLSSNSGIALARLGCKTNIFTYVGNDPWGQMVTQMLKDQMVDTSLLLTHASEPTSTTVVTIDSSGERAFIHCQGAAKRLNLATCMDHLEVLARAKFFLCGYYSLMPDLQDDLPELFAALRNCGVKTVMDTAGDGGSMKPLDQILPHLDVYIPSLTEAQHQTRETDPRKIKNLGREIKDTEPWLAQRVTILKDINTIKYQREDMKAKLLATGTKPIWECSGDGYWGVGVHLLSKKVNNTRWNGQNVFGQMLMEIRREIRNA